MGYVHKGQHIKKGDVARLEILTAIYVYALEHQPPISYKELANATGNASTSTVFRHTGILQKMGYLRKYNQGGTSFTHRYTRRNKSSSIWNCIS